MPQITFFNPDVFENLCFSKNIFKLSQHDLLNLKEECPSSFLLSTPMGQLKGTFQKDRFFFCLKVKDKPYEIIQGVEIKDQNQESISLRTKTKDKVHFSLSLSKNQFQIHQSYFHSPRPYQDYTIQKQASFFLSYRMRKSYKEYVQDKVSYLEGQPIHFQMQENNYMKKGQNPYFEIYQELKTKEEQIFLFLDEIHQQLTWKETDFYKSLLTSTFLSSPLSSMPSLVGLQEKVLKKN